MVAKKGLMMTLSILVLVAILGMSIVAYAYTTTGQKIATGNYLTFKLNSGFTSTSSTHFSDGVSAWNTASGRTLMSKSSSTHTSTNYPSNDSNNYVYRVDTGTGDYLGQTTWYYNSSTNITSEADININMHYSWANSAQPGYYDTGSVFYHEQGHVIGLNHSATNAAVMYQSIAANTVKRTLTQDDKDGADFLY